MVVVTDLVVDQPPEQNSPRLPPPTRGGPPILSPRPTHGTPVPGPARPVPLPTLAPKPTAPRLDTHSTAGAGYVKTAPSGQLREKMEKMPNGSQRTEYHAPTGRVEKEVLRKPDGTQQEKRYATNGKVQQEVVNHPNGV